MSAFSKDVLRNARDANLNTRRSLDFWKQLIPIMKTEGYVQASVNKSTHGTATFSPHTPKAVTYHEPTVM